MKLLVKHTLVYLISKIIPAFSTLLGIYLFTHSLMPDEYGKYSLTLTLGVGLGAVFYQWINTSFLVLYREYIDKESDFLSSVFISFFFISLIIAIINVVCSHYFNEYNKAIVLDLVGITIICNGWFLINQTFSNARLKPKEYAFSLAIKSICTTLFGYAAIKYGFGIDGVLWVTAVIFIISVFNNIRPWFKADINKIDFNIIKSLMSYGGPLTITFLMTFLLSFSNRFIISKMLDNASVGVFSVSYDMANYMIFTICGAMHLAGLPLILNEYKINGIRGCKKQLTFSFNLVFMISTAVVFGIIFVSREIVELFIGDAYKNVSFILLPILSIGFWFNSLKSYYFDYAFQIAKDTKNQVISPVVAVITLIVFSPFLIKIFGVEGAAYANVISFLVYMLMCVFLGKKAFDMPKIPWINCLKVIIAVIGMYISISMITLNNNKIGLFLKIFIGGGSYFSLLYLMNYLNIRTLELKSIFMRVKQRR